VGGRHCSKRQSSSPKGRARRRGTTWMVFTSSRNGQYILHYVVLMWDYDADVSRAIYRFVCRQWRDLLPPPPQGTGTCCAGSMAAFGYLELLKWATKMGCPLSDTDACTEAANDGNLEILKWLREHGCPWDESAFVVAARRGNMEILIWLRENHCPWSKKTCEFAARSGHLNVLKWARENGCDWDSDTCIAATEGGRLKTLKWLRKQNCPWIDTAPIAATCGNLEVLKWVKKEEIGTISWNAAVCAAAATGGHLKVLKWLRKKGCSWNADVCNEGDMEMLKWARDNGCPWDDFCGFYLAIADSWSINGEFERLKWVNVREWMF